MIKSKSRAGGRGVGTAAAFTILAATTFAPSALAAGHKASSTLGYAGPAGQQAALAPAAIAPAGAQASKPGGSTLPYTGADIALIGGAGVVLIGFGVGVHTLSRRSRTKA